MYWTKVQTQFQDKQCVMFKESNNTIYKKCNSKANDEEKGKKWHVMNIEESETVMEINGNSQWRVELSEELKHWGKYESVKERNKSWN